MRLNHLVTKNEIYAFLISVFILSFGFGFDDGAKTFVFQNWLNNFFMVVFLVAISLLFFILVQKYFAYRHSANLEYKLWFVTRFGFKKNQNVGKDSSGRTLKGIPLGLILSLFFTIMSSGKLPFTAVGISDVTVNRAARTGRKHIDLANYEEALIQLAGPLTNVGLIIIGVFVGNLFAVDVTKFAMINFLMAIFAMLPFSALPGAKIFFGSRSLYVFGILMIFLSFILKGAGAIGAIILAVLLALLLTGAYNYRWEN